MDLLVSLMTESTLTHFRRICASMLVYLTLLLLFAYWPMALARQLSLATAAAVAWLSSEGGATPNLVAEIAVNITSNATATATSMVVNSSIDAFDSMLDTNSTASVVSAVTVAAAHVGKLCFCYYIPVIQVPLELAIAHLSFLTLLDKKKNIIGRLQHAWLVYICGCLGLTRYLLPVPMRRRDVRFVQINIH